MAGDVAAVLLDLVTNLDRAKIADLLMCGNKMLGKKFANFGV